MYSVGIDIQDIETFRKKKIAEYARFYNRLFTPAEIDYCSSKANPPEHFAARFAAKEAVMKAVGVQKISPRNIEVIIEKDGKPVVVLHKNNMLPEGHKIEISISHSALQAAAIAMIHPD